MKVNFKWTRPQKVEPVIIEQVFAEKPGGGVVKAPAYDAPAGTAVSENTDGSFSLIKSYKLFEAVSTGDSVLKLVKGSGIAKGDVIGHGAKAVACTAVDYSNTDYDLVTVTMGVNIPSGTVLYEAASASADGAEVKATPSYVIGNNITGGEGDKAVRLINGANLRKETVLLASEIVALIPTIKLV